MLANAGFGNRTARIIELPYTLLLKIASLLVSVVFILGIDKRIERSESDIFLINHSGQRSPAQNALSVYEV